MSRLTPSTVKGLHRDIASAALVSSSDRALHNVQRFVPWRDWQDVTDSAFDTGTKSFYGSASYHSSTGRYQIINNTDSFLYITRDSYSLSTLRKRPHVLLSPFSCNNVDIGSDTLLMLAQCRGIDFTSTRPYPPLFDVRGSDVYISIMDIDKDENPALPLLRTHWAAVYDWYDLGKPTSVTAGNSFFSSLMDYTGAASIAYYVNLTIPGGASATTGIYTRSTQVPSGPIYLSQTTTNGAATGINITGTASPLVGYGLTLVVSAAGGTVTINDVNVEVSI
jgi:hypothetical protein